MIKIDFDKIKADAKRFGLWLILSPQLVGTIALVGALFIFLVIVFSGIESCNSKKKAKRDRQNAEQIIKDKGVIEVLANAQTELNQNAKNSNQNSKRADINFNFSLRRDSIELNSNFSTVRRKFCAEFPGDSKCRP